MAYQKEPAQELMGAKEYAKFDRVFMHFGSVMNSLQGTFGKLAATEFVGEGDDQKEVVKREIRMLTEWAWRISIKHVSDLVDERYAAPLKEKEAKAKSKDVGREDAELDYNQEVNV